MVGGYEGTRVGDRWLGISVGWTMLELKEDDDRWEREMEAQNEFRVEIWEHVVGESSGDVSDGGRVVMTRSRL